MSTTWPLVPLGEVLRLDTEKVSVRPDVAYEMVGVYSFGRGLFNKEPVLGINTSYKFFYRLKADHVVMSQLFGWEGALAISDDRFAGKYVSPQFPTFHCESDRLERKYLSWLMKRPSFWRELGTRTKGMGDRRRTLNPEALFSSVIPLPPLAEQRRIVARIEELAAKIEEARGLRRKALEEAKAILQSALNNLFMTTGAHWQPLSMTQAIIINDKQVNPTLPEYSGLPHISGENMQSGTCRLLPYRTAEADGVKSGNYLFAGNTILYSKIRPYLRKAVYVDFPGVCSADIYPIKVIDAELEPRFLMWSLVAPKFSEYANKLSGRTRMPKLNRTQLFGFNLTRPRMEEQRRIVAYLDVLQAKVDALKMLQEETAKELDALLPSVLDRAFKGEL